MAERPRRRVSPPKGALAKRALKGPVQWAGINAWAAGRSSTTWTGTATAGSSSHFGQEMFKLSWRKMQGNGVSEQNLEDFIGLSCRPRPWHNFEIKITWGIKKLLT